MTPAEEVQKVLDRREWTPYRLAEISGVPRSTIKRILDGNDPRTGTMDKIRKAAKKRK